MVNNKKSNPESALVEVTNIKQYKKYRSQLKIFFKNGKSIKRY